MCRVRSNLLQFPPFFSLKAFPTTLAVCVAKFLIMGHTPHELSKQFPKIKNMKQVLGANAIAKRYWDLGNSYKKFKSIFRHHPSTSFQFFAIFWLFFA